MIFKNKILTLLVFISLPSLAQSNMFDESYFTINEITIHPIVESKESSSSDILTLPQSDCGDSVSPIVVPKNFDLITLDKIVNLGKKIWSVIEDNKPKVDLSLNMAHALPSSSTCWNELTNWSLPKITGYHIIYKNLMGIEVVDFEYRLNFNFGGKFNQTGSYIANASITPIQLNVLWGYHFNAQVEISKVLNLGSEESPVAGMELKINWKVENPLNVNQKSNVYFITGDGQIVQY